LGEFDEPGVVEMTREIAGLQTGLPDAGQQDGKGGGGFCPQVLRRLGGVGK
jgi:hypothetical protein